jgi:hypothetical protein
LTTPAQEVDHVRGERGPEGAGRLVGVDRIRGVGNEDLAGVRVQVQHPVNVRGRQRFAVVGPPESAHEELAAGRQLGVREREHAARETHAAGRAVLQALAEQ